MKKIERFLITIFLLFIFFIIISGNSFCDRVLNPDLCFTLKNESSQAWVNKPITSGVMLPEDSVTSTSLLVLTDDTGTTIPAQFLSTALYPDHSLRWVLIDFQVNQTAGSRKIYKLKTGVQPPVTSSLSISENVNSFAVTSQSQTYTFNKNEFKVLNREFRIINNSIDFHAIPFANLESDAFPSPAQPWQIEEQGPLKIVLKSEGEFRGVSNPSQRVADYIRYRARIYFYAEQPSINVFLTLKNNQNFNWGANDPDQLNRTLYDFSSITFGSFNLAPASPHNLFGAGLEKTWQVNLSLDGTQANNFIYQVDPSNPANTHRAEPLLLPAREDLDRIKAWGEIVPPIKSSDNNLDSIFQRFEKMQIAKVASELVEIYPNGEPSNTVFDHLAPYLGNYKDYGCLHWAEGWSRNHYDWIYSMNLQWLRTGDSRFLDASAIMSRHQTDLDFYHSWLDGDFMCFFNHWEGAGGGNDGDHNSPFNSFGPGRPSHSWNQGYALHWLLTGDRRSYDTLIETLEGARRYLYAGAVGRVSDREIRIAGWLAECLMTGWMLEPFKTIDTAGVGSGTTTYKEAMLDALQGIIDLEQQDGAHGYVLAEEGGNYFDSIQICYVIEVLIKAHERFLKGSGDPREAIYRNLIYRMIDTLRSRIFYGQTTPDGYTPMLIPFTCEIPAPSTPPADGLESSYGLMLGNAAAYVYMQREDLDTLNFARKAFKDFVYYREPDGDGYPISLDWRVPTGYISQYFTDTESKIHGWSGRYGQYYLRMERFLGASLVNPSQLSVGLWMLY